MGMEKRALLGVRKKKPIKRNKKNFLKKVVDYLKSDCYMFAPLISSRPSVFSVPEMAFSAASGVESETPMKESRKKLLKGVWEYSKSDCHMYASLMVPEPQSSHVVLGTKIRSPCSEPLTSIATRRTTKKSNQQTKQAENVTPENPPSKDRSAELGIASEQIMGNRETVKRMVYQTCRSLSISGDEMMKLQARKSIVE